MRYFAYGLCLERDVPGIDWRSFLVDAPEYEKKALAERARAQNLTPLDEYVRLPKAGEYHPAPDVLRTVRGLIASCTASPEGLKYPAEIVRDLSLLEKLLVQAVDAGVGVRLDVNKA